MAPHNALGTLNEEVASVIWPQVVEFLHDKLDLTRVNRLRGALSSASGVAQEVPGAIGRYPGRARWGPRNRWTTWARSSRFHRSR